MVRRTKEKAAYDADCDTHAPPRRTPDRPYQSNITQEEL